LVEVEVAMIELPEEKSKEEQAVEIRENILENTVIPELVQIMYLRSSSSDKAGSKSNTDDDDVDKMKGSATKLGSWACWETTSGVSPFFGAMDKKRPLM
jgi:hypothetical protein